MRYIYKSIAILLLLVSCSSAKIPPQAIGSPQSPTATPAQVKDVGPVVTGQTIYVPIYSHIYYETKDRPFDVAATLSIRNTDLTHAITITSVRYYNTDGQLIEPYINSPLILAPLASKAFVVDRRDTRGGSGANFIVEWTASKPVTEPIAEALMISAQAGQGISFISVGRVIKRYQAPK